MSPSGFQQIMPLFQRPLKTGGTVNWNANDEDQKREDIDNMSHISVIAAIALPERTLEEAARVYPDEVIKQGMVMEHCLYYSQVQNQHLDLENIVITDQHRYEGFGLRHYPIRSWAPICMIRTNKLRKKSLRIKSETGHTRI